MSRGIKTYDNRTEEIQQNWRTTYKGIEPQSFNDMYVIGVCTLLCTGVQVVLFI